MFLEVPLDSKGFLEVRGGSRGLLGAPGGSWGLLGASFLSLLNSELLLQTFILQRV